MSQVEEPVKIEIEKEGEPEPTIATSAPQPQPLPATQPYVQRRYVRSWRDLRPQ